MDSPRWQGCLARLVESTSRSHPLTHRKQGQRVLIPGGRLVFSCESGPEDGPDLHLNPATERYVHKRSHVESLCHAAGFSTEVEETTLRYQKGQPVPGFVVTAHKPT